MRIRTTMIALAALMPTPGIVDAAPPDHAAGLIDKHLSAGWKAAKIVPAPKADDAEFLRRTYLDLVGRIPTAAEARSFLDDKSPRKREKLVNDLLSSPKADGGSWNYANHFANVWRALLLPESNNSLQARFQLPSFQTWLRNHLAADTPYDKVVHELLTAQMPSELGRAGLVAGGGDPSPAAYFFAKELMPENLAAAVSRVFLGVRLECAQCHNHPFASWKRDDFWSFAAFFSGLRRQGPGEFVVPGREEPAKREIAIPNTDRTVKARFLDGKEPKWDKETPARQTLSEWVTHPKNPYFARAAVNRLWSYFFGLGIVDPVDEMVGADASVLYPKLLDELAQAFIDSKFDLKFLIRSIVLSEAYQRTSKSPSGSQEELRHFARMPLRGLTPEQLFDSLAKATGFREAGPDLPPGVIVAGRGGNARAEFLSRFTASEKPAEHQTSILQALSLMNGRVVSDATSIERSELLRSVVDAPFFTDAGRVEALYLAALARRPTAKESARVSAFVSERLKDAKSDSERKARQSEALADVFWVLLNSGEFMLNH